MENFISVLSIVVTVLALAILVLWYVRQKKRGVSWSFGGTVVRLAGVGAVAGLGLACVVLFLAGGLAERDSTTRLTQANAENTPTSLFLTLTEASTPEAVWSAATKNEWYIKTGTNEETGLTTYTIVVDDGYLLNQDSDGVILRIAFRTEDSSFSSAVLRLQYDGKTAECLLNPEATTDCVLTLKKGLLSPEEESFYATPAEAVSAARDTLGCSF